MTATRIAPLVLLLAGLPTALPEPPATGPVVVRFHEERKEGVAAAEIDPVQRIRVQHMGSMMFGLTVDEKVMISTGAGSIYPIFKIDDRVLKPSCGPAGPLPPGPGGKRRNGGQSTWVVNKLQITELLEVIPSKAAPGAKRLRDTMLIRYFIENHDTQPHRVGLRVRVDTNCAGNDGALFASPTTHPDTILDGVELRDRNLPEYVQVLQNADLKDPGLVAHFTLKLGARIHGPDRFLCTMHTEDNGWDVAVQPANGDSGAVLFWEPRLIPPGGKLDVGYAYGKGLAATREGEGRLSLALAGSFEPHKLFTIAAYVDEPLASQALTLELPPGLELVEGKAIQPVPPSASDTSVVVWKARVRELGTHAITIRSSTGLTLSRSFTVSRAEAGKENSPQINADSHR